MATKKPGLAQVTDPAFLRDVRLMLEILTGRRGNKIEPLYAKQLTTGAGPPTQAEYNALAARVAVIELKINEIIDRLDG